MIYRYFRRVRRIERKVSINIYILFNENEESNEKRFFALILKFEQWRQTKQPKEKKMEKNKFLLLTYVQIWVFDKLSVFFLPRIFETSVPRLCPSLYSISLFRLFGCTDALILLLLEDTKP